MNTPKPKPHSNGAWLQYAGMGFQFLAACGLGFALGNYLDRKAANGQSLWTAVCTTGFMVAVMINIFMAVLKKK